MRSISLYIYIPVSLTLLSDHFMQTLERTDVEPSSHTMLCWEPEFRNAHQFPTPEITAPTTHHETKQKHVQSGDFGGFKVLMFPNHCSLVARNSLHSDALWASCGHCHWRLWTRHQGMGRPTTDRPRLTGVRVDRSRSGGRHLSQARKCRVWSKE